MQKLDADIPFAVSSFLPDNLEHNNTMAAAESRVIIKQ